MKYLTLARAIIPMFVIEVVILLVLVLFPDITLFLPRMSGLVP